MEAINDDDIRWFVLGSMSVHKEIKTRDGLRLAGFECYVPMKYEVKTVRRQQQRVLTPAITGMVFVKGSLLQIKDYLAQTREPLFLRRSTFSDRKRYLVVDTHEMENFIRATELHQENVMYFNPSEIEWHEGDRIRVKGGIYDGIEGVLMRIKGKRKKQLVVQIPNVAYAAIELEPEMVELTGNEGPVNTRLDQRSKNVEEDRRRLYDLAFRLLFVLTDKYAHESEYFITYSEMKRLRDRIKGYRGWTPQDEGELALALYMANKKMGEDVEASEARLRKAIDKIQATSLLRLKMQFLLARLSGDEALEKEVVATVRSWNPHLLTRGQQALMKDLEGILSN